MMILKRTALVCAIALVLIMMFDQVPLRAQQAANQSKPEMKLKVGDAAPDFTLLAYDGKQVTPVSLHGYKGKKNVALAFYVFAFTGG
jgi:cytochrome oxidase Cu insertion factor (SCO1/SenC/PrrC family)